MIQPKKSLGQNFLRSDRALREIVDAGHIRPNDIVLEVGPGEGVLTRRLFDKGATVIAVEKDDRLIDILEQTFEKEIKNKTVHLVHGDILDPQVKKRIVSLGCREGEYLFIANIPYYITGMIFRVFLDEGPRPKTLVLLVQREVADQIVARNGKGSILSHAVSVYGVPDVVARVPRGAFVPMPSVDSAILRVARITDPFSNDAERTNFFDVLKTGFSSKRKQLINTLSAGKLGLTKQDVAGILEKLSIHPSARPEDLTTKQWAKIAQLVQKNRNLE